MRPPVSLHIIVIVSPSKVMAHAVPVVTNLIISGRSNATYAAQDFHPQKISSATTTQSTVRQFHTYVLMRVAVIRLYIRTISIIGASLEVSKGKTTGGST